MEEDIIIDSTDTTIIDSTAPSHIDAGSVPNKDVSKVSHYFYTRNCSVNSMT